MALPQPQALRLLSAALRRASIGGGGSGFSSSSSFPSAAAAAASFSSAAATSLPADALARIKELRERTGAPLADVKASLASCGWDMDAAVEALRARGLKAAAKKSARRAAEGLVAVAESGSSSSAAAAIVEINSETDFVARNPDFQALALQAARGVLEHALKQQQQGTPTSPLFFSELSPADAAAAPMPSSSSSSTVGDAVSALAAKVRENLVLRRAFLARASSPSARLGAYVHAPAAQGVGRIVALALVEGGAGAAAVAPSSDNDDNNDIARQVAMHVAGMSPLYANESDVPEAELSAERSRLAEETARDPSSAKKPEAVRAKVVEGRLGKWMDGVVLARQPFVLDDAVKVSQAVTKAAGKGAKVAAFLRVQVGEGAGPGSAEEGGEGGGFADEVAKLASSAGKS
jgi:translation elongation factor Ts